MLRLDNISGTWDWGPHVNRPLGPLHKRDCKHMTITLQALSLGEKAELFQICFTLHLRNQQRMWMQGECKVHMSSYMASDGSCFIVVWTIFKNHLLDVGLAQNLETIALQNAHSRCFILFYFVWGPAWIKSHWINIWLKVRSHVTSHYTWGPVTTWHDFGCGLWDNLWTLSFRLSQSHGHGSRLVCAYVALAPCSHHHNFLLLLPNGLILATAMFLIHSYWSVSSLSVVVLQ